MSVALRVQGVSADYGAARVLRAVTLDVPAGSLTALLGPSGSGKTTLLKVVAGLVPATAGEVWFGDERVTGLPTERRGIAMVFQKPLLFPHMSVADNVGFGLSMRRWPGERIKDAVASALSLVQLDGYGARRPNQLSGGQEQRVALARALVTEPRILLLDEPLSALDEHLRLEMRALVRDLQRRLGITTVLVTHDQREAGDVADQIALLLDGSLVQSGPPRAFYTDPATVGAARFFGWCVLQGRAEGGRFLAGGTSFALPPDLGSGASPDAVAFHPSIARLCRISSPVPPHSSTATLPARVEQVIDLGPQRRIAVRFAGGERVEVVQFGERVTQVGEPLGGGGPAIGEEAAVQVPASAVRTFKGTMSVHRKEAAFVGDEGQRQRRDAEGS